MRSSQCHHQGCTCHSRCGSQLNERRCPQVRRDEFSSSDCMIPRTSVPCQSGALSRITDLLGLNGYGRKHHQNRETSDSFHKQVLRFGPRCCPWLTPHHPRRDETYTFGGASSRAQPNEVSPFIKFLQQFVKSVGNSLVYRVLEGSMLVRIVADRTCPSKSSCSDDLEDKVTRFARFPRVLKCHCLEA